MEQLPQWANLSIATAGALGSLVTAVATFFLWRVTKILARETTRMAKAAAQPHVVATILPNRWSMIHFDLHIDNSGNAPAYDIKIEFDPPLENGKDRKDELPIPLQNLSVLKPGQGMSSFLADYQSIKGKSYSVSISWKTMPNASVTEHINYTLNINDLEGISTLGSDPLVQIATHIKKIDENSSNVFKGSRRLKVDTFNSSDRAEENRRIRAQFAEMQARRKQKNPDGKKKSILNQLKTFSVVTKRRSK